ncbi:MAG: hypothetical protein JWQ42_508 [Edaphobacter sp.]|nr:hypothetical protein [Edaphobacter sp.]
MLTPSDLAPHVGYAIGRLHCASYGSPSERAVAHSQPVGSSTVISMGIHCNRDITSCFDFIDRQSQFLAIDRRVHVVGRGKPDILLTDEKAMIAQVIVCIVNQDIEENAAKELFTISLGISAS